MKVFITGGSGFIGRALVRLLVERKYEVIVLSRHPDKVRALFPEAVRCRNINPAAGWPAELYDGAAVINLAGENLASGIWTKNRKACIVSSRIETGRMLAQAFMERGVFPKVLIQASAVGYYGDSGSQVVDETGDHGSGFLADLVRQWENSISGILEHGVRCVRIRTGLVLGKSGGLLPHLLRPYWFFLGGYMGSGHQGFPWIHIDDELRAIVFLLENEHLQGIFNLTAPQQITAKEFSRNLARIIGKPSWLPVPAAMLKILPGGMGRELLLNGQLVKPRRLLEAGFGFTYPDIASALQMECGSATAH
jgi:uncharacterized protein (TIGR01777 family)